MQAKKGAKSGKKSGKKRAKSASESAGPKEVDPMGTAAMTNLYYIAHNAADALVLRGYEPPGEGGGKKKKKGKKK